MDSYTPEQLEQTVIGLSTAEQAFLRAEMKWMAQARDKQVLPIDFRTGLLMTGRGWGKTITAAAWARRMAGTLPGSIGHVIAPTHGDLRGTVFEGPTGLLNVIPKAMIAEYNKTPYLEIRLLNGTWIRGFSAEKPDRLRGPQCHWLWGDEYAAWQYIAEMMQNIEFSTRLVYVKPDGTRVQPSMLITTTPRPLEEMRALAEAPHGTGVGEVWQVRGSLQENRDNLAETFVANIEKHEGTRLGEQEIHGIILNFDDSAIIKKRWLRMWPKNRPLPQFEFIFLSYDTAFTEETYDEDTHEADYSACTAWGVFMFEKRMNVMLIDAWRERLGMPDLIERARKDMKMEYGYVDPPQFKVYAGQAPSLMRAPRKPQLMIIEDKGSGISLRQLLAKEQVPMHPYNPGKASKLERVNGIAYVVKGGPDEGHGRVWLIESEQPDKKSQPKFVDWADQFIAEVCIYNGPGSTKHDDYVDTFSQGMKFFADRYIDGKVGEKIRKKPPPAPPRPHPYG